MQRLFHSFILLTLVALFGASTVVSAYMFADQSYTKPMNARKGGLVTATLDGVVLDIDPGNSGVPLQDHILLQVFVPNATAGALQVRSAKMTPNKFVPKVAPQTMTVGDNTVVTFPVPSDQIVLEQPYTFDIKLKVGSSVQSGAIFPVTFATAGGVFEDTCFVHIK